MKAHDYGTIIANHHNGLRGFLKRVDRLSVPMIDGCIVWAGEMNHKGYGRIIVNRKHIKVHRAMWFLAFGEIPPGLVVNHKCRQRACINVDHLELVTNIENIMHPDSQSIGAVNARKTHCKHGHEFTPENTRVRIRNGTSQRDCRACHREGERRRRDQRTIPDDFQLSP